MMTKFEFAAASRVIFGAGTLRDSAVSMAAMGERALVVTGRTPQRARPLMDMMANQGTDVATFSVGGEPTIELVKAGVELARSERCDFIISIGGGSVLDAGKAIAALSTNPGDPLDYLEVIGKGQPLGNPPLPFVAIPTTAGTGSEVTRNAVLASPEHRIKVSLRNRWMLPRLSIVDPELTYSLPPETTAQTGMDALTQVLEPFVSHEANPITDGFCREGLRRAASSLRRAYDHGDDVDAREDMALASLLGGLALANAKLGAVHGFAGPIGGMLEIPHGLICAILLPHVMAVNLQVLRQRGTSNPALDRYAEIAHLLTGQDNVNADDAVEWIRNLAETLQIPSLRDCGVNRTDFPAIVEKSAHSSSMRGNPVELTPSERQAILERAL